MNTNKAALLDYSLYLVTDRKMIGERDLLTVVEEAIKGGVTLIQLREKQLCARDLYFLAQKMKERLISLGIPLIINDDVAIIMAVNADGVHLGAEDLPVEVARKILGPDKIIGRSVSNPEEAFIAVEKGADYLALSPLFPTTTKEGCDVGLQDEVIAEILARVDIPVVGIGGINQGNIEKVAGYSLAGVAVVSAILSKENCYLAAKELKEKWRKAVGERAGRKIEYE